MDLKWKINKQINLKNQIVQTKLVAKNIFGYSSNPRSRGRFFSTDSIDFRFSPGMGPRLCGYRGKKK